MSLNGAPKIILVVDDDRAIVDLIKRQMEAEGYATLGVTTAAEALEAARTTRLIAVLLDLGLGEASGFDVLAKIKAEKPGLPVIMVTGSHDEKEARRAFELGAWDYVTKPVDFTYLKNILLLQSGA